MKKKTKIILTLLLVFQLIALRVLSYFPEWVEKYYSLGVFPVISKVWRYLFGWIPFSVGDVFYSAIIILALRWFYFNIRTIKTNPVGFFLTITATLSVVYFFFNMMWGFNYYRLPLHQTLGLEKEYTTEQLVVTTKKLIEKSNQLHSRLAISDTLKVESPYSQKEIFKFSTNGYENLSEIFPLSEYHPKSVKNSTWNLMLSYMGNSGYYNPFTAEAQTNALIPDIHFPVVTCHEEAHQLGYAAENEANFLAYLATTYNDDVYFQYAGTIFALRYCLSDLQRRDEALHDIVVCDINIGIRKNFRELYDFWLPYEGPLEFISGVFFDTFLKANNQKDGIESYNYMVALLVNYLNHP